MGPTQISIAIIMVGVVFAGILWLHADEAAASARRMMDMMTRVGLAPGAATFSDPLGTEARRRCRRCPREGLCDRWLSGTVEGGNAFCPNAQTFRLLTEAGPRTA